MERIPDIIVDEKTATASLHRKHKTTNPLTAIFDYKIVGPRRNEETFEQVEGGRSNWNLASNGLPWMRATRCRTGLNYPVLVRNHGWMKAYLSDAHFQASRGDLNMDVQIYRMEYDADGEITKKTSLGARPDFNVGQAAEANWQCMQLGKK